MEVPIHPGGGDVAQPPSYSFTVSLDRGARVASTEERTRPSLRWQYRWIRPLAVFVVGFLVTTAFQVHPGPGLRGVHLGVTLALVGFAASTLTMVGTFDLSVRVQGPVLVIAVVSAAALVGFQPGGPGFLGVFPAVSGAALRLPDRASAGIAGLAVLSLAVAWAAGGHHPVTGIVLNELGVIAFFMLSMFARRLREANERAQALIVELEQTRAAQAQAAALAERQRLAREMHDVLAHSLSGLVLNLEGARLLAERDGGDGEITLAIERAHRLARTGLQEARRAIGMLRDDELPGPQGLPALVTEFEQDTGVPCTLEVHGSERELNPDARLTIYRVAQEALTNIRKHTDANRVDMRLVYEEGGTRLSVDDVSSASNGSISGGRTGYGLTGMRERAALLGGTLDAGPTSEGFRVELWVPA